MGIFQLMEDFHATVKILALANKAEVPAMLLRVIVLSHSEEQLITLSKSSLSIMILTKNKEK